MNDVTVGYCGDESIIQGSLPDVVPESSLLAAKVLDGNASANLTVPELNAQVPHKP